MLLEGARLRAPAAPLNDLLGKIVRIRDFLTHAEALEAAGLAE